MRESHQVTSARPDDAVTDALTNDIFETAIASTDLPFVPRTIYFLVVT